MNAQYEKKQYENLFERKPGINKTLSLFIVILAAKENFCQNMSI
jgi:hypothetical protein